jgi:hypothetical protein
MMADIRAITAISNGFRHAILGALAHRRCAGTRICQPPSGVFSRQRLDVELMSGVSRSSRVLMNPVARLAAVIGLTETSDISNQPA